MIYNNNNWNKQDEKIIIVEFICDGLGILQSIASQESKVMTSTRIVLYCCIYVYVVLLYYCCCIVLRCGGLLLNVIFIFSSARCIRWPLFALIRFSSRCIIDVMQLHSVCCSRLIRTLIIVCSVSFHLLMSEFDILELRLQLIHQSLKYQGVERPNLQGVSCQPRLVCEMTFPTLCLTPECQMGLREQSIVVCFMSFVFQFSVEQVLWGCESNL